MDPGWTFVVLGSPTILLEAGDIDIHVVSSLSCVLVRNNLDLQMSEGPALLWVTQNIFWVAFGEKW